MLLVGGGVCLKASGLFSEKAIAAFISCKVLLNYYSSFGLRLMNIQKTSNLATTHYPQAMPCRQQRSSPSL